MKKSILALSLTFAFGGSVFADCGGCFGSAEGGVTFISSAPVALFLGVGGAAINSNATYEYKTADMPVASIWDGDKIDATHLPTWTKQIGHGDDVILTYKPSSSASEDAFWAAVLKEKAPVRVKDGFQVVISENEQASLTQDFALDVFKHGGHISEIRRVPPDQARAYHLAEGKAKLLGKAAWSTLAIGAVVGGAGFVNEHVRENLIDPPFTPETPLTID